MAELLSIELSSVTFAESFQLFERAAAKGHEESIWILSVLKDVTMEQKAWKEAFAKTEEPLGWYFTGKFSDGRERFDFFKKSAEGGCSWGQVAYSLYLKMGYFVEKDMRAYVEWLEKAANQNNPQAMEWLGSWFQWEGGGDKEKAVSYYRAGAELGWKNSMGILAVMLRDGEGCEKDLRQAVIWSAKRRYSTTFWNLLKQARRTLEKGVTGDLGCDFDQLCYSLGWGLYWYQYGNEKWNMQSNDNMAIGERCLNYYCSCVELQQKSIFTFLLCWNRTTGIKGPGQMIAQMVWEGREESLVIEYGDGEDLQEKPAPRRSARLKRIKK
jgi:TPR repeat protein